MATNCPQASFHKISRMNVFAYQQLVAELILYLIIDYILSRCKNRLKLDEPEVFLIYSKKFS
jgi:hypothetical protein